MSIEGASHGRLEPRERSPGGRSCPGDPPDPEPRDDAAAAARALAERSAVAAGEGRVDEARRGFAAALEGAGTDLRVLFLCFQFHFRVGELDEAERLVRRRLEVGGADADSPYAARAYSNLGLVHCRRGEFDAAEAALRRALAIDSHRRDEYGAARDLGNLALVFESRGELDRAEAMYREALAVADRIGAEDLAATKLANLGDIALTRGRAAEARGVWARALGIFERIGPARYRDEVAAKLAGLDGKGGDAAPASPG